MNPQYSVGILLPCLVFCICKE